MVYVMPSIASYNNNDLSDPRAPHFLLNRVQPIWWLKRKCNKLVYASFTSPNEKDVKLQDTVPALKSSKKTNVDLVQPDQATIRSYKYNGKQVRRKCLPKGQQRARKTLTSAQALFTKQKDEITNDHVEKSNLLNKKQEAINLSSNKFEGSARFPVSIQLEVLPHTTSSVHEINTGIRNHSTATASASCLGSSNDNLQSAHKDKTSPVPSKICLTQIKSEPIDCEYAYATRKRENRLMHIESTENNEISVALEYFRNAKQIVMLRKQIEQSTIRKRKYETQFNEIQKAVLQLRKSLAAEEAKCSKIEEELFSQKMQFENITSEISNAKQAQALFLNHHGRPNKGTHAAISANGH